MQCRIWGVSTAKTGIFILPVYYISEPKTTQNFMQSTSKVQTTSMDKKARAEITFGDCRLQEIRTCKYQDLINIG